MDISNNSTGSKESFFYKILWRIRTALSCIPESPALINNYHCLLNVLIHPIFFELLLSLNRILYKWIFFAKTCLTFTIWSVSLPTIDLFYYKQCIGSGSVESTTFWLTGSGSESKRGKIYIKDCKKKFTFNPLI